MITRYRWTGRALSAALLATSLGACEFIEPTTSDPNNVPNANVDQLFTGVQVNTFYLSESIYARVAGMWTQQLAGVTSQFTGLDQYKFGEDDTDDVMSDTYTGGGLIDIRRAIARAEELERPAYAGILKIYEAWLIGTAADIYGDIPYSEAVDPDVTNPALDPQLEVYQAIQARLDEAIANLQTGGGGPGQVDLNFSGDTECWTRVAYSLKARFYMHVAEVNPGAYQQALDAAQQGIASIACNWRAIHTTAATETNIWHQFQRDRPDHLVAGFFLTNILNGGTPADMSDDDPRLPIFFQPATRSTVAGQFIGSKPGAPEGDVDEGASPLNISAGGIAAPGYDQPIISCSETQFIIAEVQARAGNAAAAREAANRGIACQEARFNVELPDIDASLTGDALLREILEQKYIALILNIEVWNDYKRTCFPNIETFQGQPVPGRLLYGTTERQTNPNVPDVGTQRQSPRNPNDPNPCTT